MLTSCRIGEGKGRREGLFCQVSNEMLTSYRVGEGGREGVFSARCLMGCSIMCEIWFGKVISYPMIQAKHLAKRQKRVGGGAFRPICSRVRFCQLNTIVFLYERLKIMFLYNEC